MSLTPDSARQALETAFIAAWAAAHPTIPYYIAGVSEPDLTKQTTPFAMFEVSVPKVEQSGLNGATPPKRYYGQILVDLYAPKGSGTQIFFQMVATIENTLSITIISGILLKSLNVFKRTPAIGWQGRSLTIPYQFDSLP